MARGRTANETFSLAVKGAKAHGPHNAQSLTIGDSSATLTQMQQSMMTGTHVLCKGPDGQLAYYTLDAERSTPSIPVLRPV